MRALLILLLLSITALAQDISNPVWVPQLYGSVANTPPLSGMVIWMNPTNGTDTVSDGAAVTYWTNSVNSALFTPLVYSFNTGTKAIYRATGAINNQACLYFPNSYYLTATQPTTNWSQIFWIFAVLRSTNRTSNADTDQHSFRGNTGGSGAWLQIAGSTGGTFGMSAGTVLDSGFNYTNRWVLISAKYNGASSIIRTNGVQAVTGNAGTGTFGNQFSLGSDGSATFLWRGFIAEYIVYARDLSAGDLSTVETYFITKYALPDTSPHPTFNFVSAVGAGTTRNNFSGNLGYAIGPVQDMYVTSLGRWMLSGNSSTHTVQITSGGSVVSSASVNMSGGTVGTFIYTALSSPFFVKAVGQYNLESVETSGGDTWYNNNATLTLGQPNDAASIHGIGCVESEFNGSFSDAGCNVVWIPPSFQYYVP